MGLPTFTGPSGGWLASQEAEAADGGTPTAWAEERHKEARFVWDQLPERHIVDDAYYSKVHPAASASGAAPTATKAAYDISFMISMGRLLARPAR